MKVDDVGLERLHHAANLEPLAQVVSALAGEFLIAADIDGIPLNPVRQTPGQAIHMVGDSSRPPISYIQNSQTFNPFSARTAAAATGTHSSAAL